MFLSKDNKESGEKQQIELLEKHEINFIVLLHANHNTQFNFALRK
jgi:hypothetical protein